MNNKKSKKLYAIKVGRKSNIIVDNWKECQALTESFSGAKFKSFKDINLAKNYLENKKESNSKTIEFKFHNIENYYSFVVKCKKKNLVPDIELEKLLIKYCKK